MYTRTDDGAATLVAARAFADDVSGAPAAGGATATSTAGPAPGGESWPPRTPRCANRTRSTAAAYCQARDRFVLDIARSLRPNGESPKSESKKKRRGARPP